MTYNYEEARRASVTKVYGEMTIGVIVTAIVAFIGQMTGAYYAFLASTGVIGLIALLCGSGGSCRGAWRPSHQDEVRHRPRHVLCVRGAYGLLR